MRSCARLRSLCRPVSATLPENIETWRKNWQRWASVRVAGADVNEDAAQAAKAEAHNEKLTGGRLTDFAVGERPLGEVIFEDLQQAISLRFPDHIEAGEQTELQRELDLQEELIAAATQGFIGRDADLAVLDGYADSDDARLSAVGAAGGIGKTTLLAKWIAIGVSGVMWCSADSWGWAINRAAWTRCWHHSSTNCGRRDVSR